MRSKALSRFFGSLFVLACVFSLALTADAQKMDRIERERMKDMLKNIKKQVEKNYYDPNFKGIDLEARFKQAEERLKQVETTGQAFGVIAQVLIEFNDSHLYFSPPATNLDIEYGWRMLMVGDNCYIYTVKPETDAAAKGLKPGDQILSIEGFRPTRSELWKMNYYYNVLSKRQKMRMTVLSPGAAQPRELEIESKIKKLPKVITMQMLGDLFDKSGEDHFDWNKFRAVGGTLIWKMPSFAFDPKAVDTFMQKVKGSSSLILDLRGNGGGYVDTLERLAGFMFDRDLTIAELKGRKPLKPQESKSRGADVYKGDLIVLIDHRSGSAAEIFARLVQLEKRGRVLGDVSAGAVMQSRGYPFTMGANDEVFYSVSITNADVIMSDGKSLEHVGVTPDEKILMTGADLANQKDPVLARALELLGTKVTPEEAGKYFRYVWKNDRLMVEEF